MKPLNQRQQPKQHRKHGRYDARPVPFFPSFFRILIRSTGLWLRSHTALHSVGRGVDEGRYLETATQGTKRRKKEKKKEKRRQI